MANFYVPDLTANATAEEIVGEITFIEILKSSAIETPTEFSDDEIAHLDRLLVDLQQRFERAERTAQQPAVPSAWRGGQWNGQGYHNGLGGEQASALSPVGGLFAGSASSSHFEPSAVGTSTPFDSPGISLKRSRTLSTNHNGPCHSASKRHSSNPSPSTASSQSPISLDDDLTDFDFGGGDLKPIKSEPGLLASHGTNGRHSGVGLGQRHASQSGGGQQSRSIKVENGATLGRHSQLATRPHVQPHNQSQFGSTAASSSCATANSRIPSIKHEAGTLELPWDLEDFDDFPATSTFKLNGNTLNEFHGQNNNPIRFGQSSSLGPSNHNANSNGYRSVFSRPHHEEPIDLTGDSPPGGDQNDPIMLLGGRENNLCLASSSNTGHNNSLAASNGLSACGNMPGAFPNDSFFDLDSAYTAQQTNNGPLQGQYTPAPAYRNQGNQLMDTDLQIGSFETTSWMTDDDLARLLGISPDGALLESTSSTALTPGPSNEPPPPPHLGFLTRMGLGNLEDEMSVRSPEELKKLLENIRPDEDLPPELREQTPMQMEATLMEHQKLGLAWLKKMEEGSNKGGILADDMGLGKTIQALSLILARPSEDPLRKTTLIIAPVALMRQWEKEIRDKVKPQFHLKVHVYHGSGKKSTFNKLRQNDVVLTTFGTLGSEFKRKKDLLNRMAGQQDANLAALDDLPLVGDKCKWYRVIIDEAQCIKNKSTRNAQAAMELQSIHRLCMTGTPMMNSVDELYSLIKFLRIGPYDEWFQFNTHFGRPIRNLKASDRSKENAMKKLQALLKAILLRRTKSSLVDGKPIIQIPPKHVHKVEVTFSADELQLYKALESKTQVAFNRYLKQNSVVNNYANILVLLLRLRQFCCHPHLIKDLSVNTSVKDIPENDLKAMAAELGEDVVARLKGHEGFECPVCYDAVENPTIFIPCGHNTCSECFAKLIDPQRAIQAGDEHAQARCPECRNDIRSNKITDFQHFVKVHMPEEGDEAEIDEEDDQDSDSDSDSDEEDDQDETLGGFIVDDEDEGVTENDQSDFEESKVKKSKGKGTKSKGKGKKVQRDKPKKFKKTLAQLKQESLRNRAAKDKYIRRLKHDWEPSAKIDKTVELLQEIEDNDSSEKTIVFSQFTSLLDLLEVPLTAKKAKYERYDGSMKANERVDAVNKFMETTTCKLMLISLKAGNAGLNLNKASHVIILDPFWNPYIEEQAVDRAHRMMQKREVHVHRLLVPNTVEDRILELQERKRQMISQALDETAAKGISRLGARELGFLFGLNSL